MRVIPMGENPIWYISNAPVEFQRFMEDCLDGYRDKYVHLIWTM